MADLTTPNHRKELTMKRSLVTLCVAMSLLIAASIGLSAFAQGSRRVGGYTRRNGTYVKPHYRTRADRTQRNNWSTKGNRNPYTGKRGTKRPR
jgi:hypothetical protein